MRAADPSGESPLNGGALLDAYRQAAEVGRLAVADQVAELDAIRNRSSTFLAFVGSSTAFLVGTAIRGSAGNPRAGFVVIAIIGCLSLTAQLLLFCSVMLGSNRLWPVGQLRAWDSRLSGKAYADWLSGDLAVRAPGTLIQFYRHLANEYETQFVANREYLRTTRARYVLFMMTGFLNLLLWALAAWLYGIG